MSRELSNCDNLLHALGDGPAVLRSEGKSAQDEEIESALGKIETGRRHAVPFRFDKRVSQFLSKRKGAWLCRPAGSRTRPSDASLTPALPCRAILFRPCGADHADQAKM